MTALACAVVLNHSVTEICVPRTPVDVTRDASMSCVVLQAEAAAAEVKDLQTALADAQHALKMQRQTHDQEIEGLVRCYTPCKPPPGPGSPAATRCQL